jgi:hypothetical protein
MQEADPQLLLLVLRRLLLHRILLAVTANQLHLRSSVQFHLNPLCLLRRLSPHDVHIVIVFAFHCCALLICFYHDLIYFYSQEKLVRKRFSPTRKDVHEHITCLFVCMFWAFSN